MHVRKVSTFCLQMVMGGQQRDTHARTCWIDVFATSSVLDSLRSWVQSVPEKRLFLPSYSLINSLRNARDSDLIQIEDAFKDPEDRFWEENSSEGIVGNTKVQSNLAIRTRLIRSPRYFEVIFLSLHLKSTPLFRTCQQQSTRRNSQATNKEWGPSSNRDSLTVKFLCCWGSRDSRANKPVVIRQKY